LLPHVGVGAAWRTAGVEPGSTVAIFGLGSIGFAVWTLSTLFFFFATLVICAKMLNAIHWLHRLQREQDFVEQLGL